MATDKNTIKQWFRNKLKPTQEQFWAWLDSYWHKGEKIPVSVISGLNDLLNSSATVESLEALRKQVELLQQLVQSDDASLNELQEIVNFIKQNKQVLDTLAISNITGLQDALTELSERLTVAENKGLQNAATIRLQANTPKVYVLPSSAMLFAIKVTGTGMVQVGRTESNLDDIGEIESNGNAVLQFGLLDISEVWLQSDQDIEIRPIVYII